MSGSRLAFAIFIELAVLAGMPKPAMPRNRQNHNQPNGLSEYIERVSAKAPVAPSSTSGSLWNDSGRLANRVSDYKASRVGDLVTISVAQNPSRFEYWECFCQPKLYCEFGDQQRSPASSKPQA